MLEAVICSFLTVHLLCGKVMPYVPQLRNNLLSVLFLTVHCGIKVEIMGTVIRFYKMGKLIMTATVNGRLGYLDGDMLT